MSGNLSCRPALPYEELSCLFSNPRHVFVCCIGHVLDDISPSDAKLLGYYAVFDKIADKCYSKNRSEKLVT